MTRMRRLPVSAMYTAPSGPTAMPCGPSNSAVSTGPSANPDAPFPASPAPPPPPPPALPPPPRGGRGASALWGPAADEAPPPRAPRHAVRLIELGDAAWSVGKSRRPRAGHGRDPPLRRNLADALIA